MEQDFVIEKKQLAELFQFVRKRTEQLCQPLLIEDYVIQSTIDVSPPKWHLAHTTWFFETLLLIPHLQSYQVFHPQFNFLFNSCVQEREKSLPRENRGLLSRPTLNTIYDYRLRVDERILNLIMKSSQDKFLQLQPLINLALQHEQQHQELLLMDIKHNFSVHPSFPAYHSFPNKQMNHDQPAELLFLEVQGGEVELDNELLMPATFLKPYAIANRLVTNAEFYEFILEGGYNSPSYWSAQGWNYVVQHNWKCPLYWHLLGTTWYIFTLAGLKKMNPDEPVAHVSYYEADAYARWCKNRLPLEAEWTYFVKMKNLSLDQCNLLENLLFHPAVASKESDPQQFFGDVWEWTATPSNAYDSFSSVDTANCKLQNLMLLRGGSCVTPHNPSRKYYRHFFQPDKRWQFSGIRLAHDL